MNPTDNLQGVESSWVQLCPFLGVRPPHPLIAKQDPLGKQVMELYDFFKQENPSDPMGAFTKHYASLAKETGLKETKLQQMTNSINMIQVARNAKTLYNRTKRSLGNVGIKI